MPNSTVPADAGGLPISRSSAFPNFGTSPLARYQRALLLVAREADEARDTARRVAVIIARLTGKSVNQTVRP